MYPALLHLVLIRHPLLPRPSASLMIPHRRNLRPHALSLPTPPPLPPPQKKPRPRKQHRKRDDPANDAPGYSARMARPTRRSLRCRRGCRSACAHGRGGGIWRWDLSGGGGGSGRGVWVHVCDLAVDAEPGAEALLAAGGGVGGAAGTAPGLVGALVDLVVGAWEAGLVGGGWGVGGKRKRWRGICGEGGFSWWAVLAGAGEGEPFDWGRARGKIFPLTCIAHA